MSSAGRTLMSSQAEFRALLEEAKSEPDDDTPRLVLADWLQDRGDERGEFIHLQVRRARLAEGDPECEELRRREKQILGRHVFDWLGPLADLASDWHFHRGLVALDVRAPRLLGAAGDELARGGCFDWVEAMALRDATPAAVARLSDSPILERLTCLDLSDNRLGDRGLARLGRSRRLIALRELRLAGNRLGDDGVRNLADWAQLEGLFRLDLSRNRFGDDGALALARSDHLDELTGLDVRGNAVHHDGAAALRSRFGGRVRIGPAGGG